MLKTAVMLLAILFTGEPAEVSTVPIGTVLSIKATVCFRKTDMDQIINAELTSGSGHEVYKSLDGCNNFCINAAVIEEERRFLIKKQLYAVFEVIGLKGSLQSFWASTAILPSGWPIPMSEQEHTARCAELPTPTS